MDKTKILFVIPNFGLGGTSSALLSLLNSTLTNYYDMDVFAIRRQGYTSPQLASHDIGHNSLTTAFYDDYSRFSKKNKLKYLFIKLLKQNHRTLKITETWVLKRTIRKVEHQKKYDVIVGFQEDLATRFASHFICPHKIAWIHCDYASAYGDTVDELGLYNHFEKIVCVSQFTRKGFVERYPSLATKTVAIHNLFDAERIAKLSKEAINDPQYDTSRFTVISLGRVHEVKRFYLIPEVAAQLKNAGVDFRWYILGNAGIPSELKRLTDAIYHYGTEKYVIYLGGKSNPYPYLKAADLLVSTSKSEACPMIFNEAKILHVPILSVDYGSAFEFIEQGKDGYITSIEGLSQKLIELINQPNKLIVVKNSNTVTNVNDEIIEMLIKLFTENRLPSNN